MSSALFTLFIVVLVFAVACNADSIKRLLEHRYARGYERPTPSGAVITAYKQTPLDHFSPDDRTWSQRYFVNPRYYNGTGPIVFLVGWEGAQSPDYIDGTFVVDEWAERYGALLVDLEHRFYGDSIPLKDQSMANLKYLSSEQAIADAAVFVPFIQSLYNATSSPVILVGGSYSGNLAAWLRLKYPHLFIGAMAISAPVQAVLDYYAYNVDVAHALGRNCSSFLRRGSDRVTELLQDKVKGWAQLKSDMNLCDLTSDFDGGILIQYYANYIMGTVQYAVDDDIERFCSAFMQESNDPYEAIVKHFFSNGGQCTDVGYQHYVESELAAGDGRSWTYQTCAEFGYYQTADSREQPFSSFLSLPLYVQQCADVFNISADRVSFNVDWTNINYGGQSIVTSETVFSNGDLDPWHAAGILSGRHGFQNEIAIIARGSHCTDIMPSRSTDSASLKHARAIQIAAMDRWLQYWTPQTSVPLMQ